MVTILMATPVATLSPIGDSYKLSIRSSLGQTLSGWRDLNSRPLDPQIGPPAVFECEPLIAGVQD
jgi:hypothetical protein